MNSALAEPVGIYEVRSERERRTRINQAIRSGERIVTADAREHEYFTQITHHITHALCTAKQLTGAQYRLILMVAEHSSGLNSPYAVTDLADREVPQLDDWCMWLGVARSTFCATRASLVKANVLCYVDGNPQYLTINSEWETWDPALFEERTGNNRSGRKPMAICNLPAIISPNNEQAYIGQNISIISPNNIEPVVIARAIHGDADENAREARQDAARSDSASTRSKKRERKKPKERNSHQSDTTPRDVRSDDVPTPLSEPSQGLVRRTNQQDLPEEYTKILDVLHSIDGWPTHSTKSQTLERETLQSLIPLSVGGVGGGGLTPEFTLWYAHDYRLWTMSEQDADERAGREPSQPSIRRFKAAVESAWHRPNVQKKYREWRSDQSRAQMVTASTSSLGTSYDGARLSPELLALARAAEESHQAPRLVRRTNFVKNSPPAVS
jgi:hypothetical protein